MNAEKVPLNAYYRYGPPTFRPYSPECVEGEFSEFELPIYGVLGSSHKASEDGIMLVVKREDPPGETGVRLG